MGGNSPSPLPTLILSKHSCHAHACSLEIEAPFGRDFNDLPLDNQITAQINVREKSMGGIVLAGRARVWYALGYLSNYQP